MKAPAAVWGRKGHLQAAADPTTTVFGTSVGGSLCVGAHTLRDISVRSQAPRMLVALQAQPAGHHQNWQLPDTRKNFHKVALTAAYGDQLLPLSNSNQWGHRECNVLGKEIKARCPMVLRRPLSEQQCCLCPGAGGPSRLPSSPQLHAYRRGRFLHD